VRNQGLNSGQTSVHLFESLTGAILPALQVYGLHHLNQPDTVVQACVFGDLSERIRYPSARVYGGDRLPLWQFDIDCAVPARHGLFLLVEGLDSDDGPDSMSSFWTYSLHGEEGSARSTNNLRMRELDSVGNWCELFH